MNYSSKYSMEQMGHSSIQVTMDVYGHLFPSSQSRIRDDFDIAIEPSDPYEARIDRPAANPQLDASVD